MVTESWNGLRDLKAHPVLWSLSSLAWSTARGHAWISLMDPSDSWLTRCWSVSLDSWSWRDFPARWMLQRFGSRDGCELCTLVHRPWAREGSRESRQPSRNHASAAWESPGYFGTLYLPVPACLEALVFGAVWEQAGNAAVKMFCSLGSGGVSALLPSCTSWESWKVSPVSVSWRREASEHEPQAAVSQKNVGKLMIVNGNVSKSLRIWWSLGICPMSDTVAGTEFCFDVSKWNCFPPVASMRACLLLGEVLWKADWCTGLFCCGSL